MKIAPHLFNKLLCNFLRLILFPLARPIFMVVALAAAVTLGGAQHANAGYSDSLKRQCQQPPKIDIKVPSTQPVYTATMPKAHSSAMRAGWSMAGATRLDKEITRNITWKVHKDRTGSCLRVASVTLEIGTHQPQIWLAGYVKRDSCLREVVKKHEMEHVQHHQQYVSRVRQNLRKSLPTMLRGHSHAYLASPKTADQTKPTLEREIALAILKITKPHLRDTRLKDRNIDTRANYTRILAACK